jgi:DivIVA domain-containing protein
MFSASGADSEDGPGGEAFSGSGGVRPQGGVAEAGTSKWARPGQLTGDDVRRVAFSKPSMGRRGYDEESVDNFLDKVESDLRARHAGGPVVRVALTAADVRAVAFLRPPFGRRGYDEEQVDRFLDEVQRSFVALDRDLSARGTTVVKG